MTLFRLTVLLMVAFTCPFPLGARIGKLGWRQRLFGVTSRDSLQGTVYFGILPRHVVELGIQVR